MATHDYVIANGTGAAVRSDLNGALAAIVSNNSSATEPATMYAYQWWADTTTGLLKLRNSANNAWISLRELDGTLTVEDGTAAAPGLAFTSDLNTGLFRVGSDQIAISTGGTSRLAVSTTAVSSTLAVDVPLGAVGTPSITFTGDLNTGIWSPAADTIAISTGGTSRITVDASGRLLVGTASASGDQLLVVQGYAGVSAGNAEFGLRRGANPSAVDQSLGAITFQNSSGDSGARIEAVSAGSWTSGTNHQSYLTFSTTSNGGSSPTERVRITSTGQVRLAGAGITFNGDTATANELDDYEEGTWTPNQGAGLTIVGSFSSSGRYTKIGRIVHVQFEIKGSTSIACTAAGLVCSNLPFPASGVFYYPGAATSQAYNVSNGGMAYASDVYNFESFAATTAYHYCLTYNIA